MPKAINHVIYDGSPLIDLRSDTVTDPSHIIAGYYGHLADGRRVLGTGQVGPLVSKTITLNGTYTAEDDSVDGYSEVTVNVANGATMTEVANTYGTGVVITSASATRHTLYFEYEDETTETVYAYYDDALIGPAITATTPTTHNNKTVTLAQLDGVTWYSYNPSAIPLNTQLIDFTKVTNDYAVSASYLDGEEFEYEWAAVSDYTLIDPSMTFTYKGASQFDLCFYDSAKTFISGFSIGEDTGSSDQIATGTLTPAKIPSNAKYIRIDSFRNPDDTELSLIRTA